MLNLVLVAVPLLVVFFWWTWGKRQRDIAQFVRSRLLANLTVGVSARRQKARLVLMTIAVACVLVALARPQWGYALEEVKQRGLDILVAFDTSKSMLATDVMPNRLTRAKLAALELVPLARTDRLGLVAFAGTAFLQCPLTIDDDAFRQSINSMNVGIIPQGGTALAEALQTALTAFKNDEDNEKVILLITDGEDHEEGVVDAAEAAAKAGVHIFTIGVGTPQGELLQLKDAQGHGDYVRDEGGNVVKSRLNEGLLRQLATIGRGFYLQLRGANTMDVLYERGLSPLLGQTPSGLPSRAAKSAPRLIKHFQERFQWPLGLAILLLIVELFLPDRKLARRPEPAGAARPAGARRGVLVALALLLGVSAANGSASKALQLYKEGKYEAAWQEYQRLLNRNPKDARLAYNAGVSAYQAGEYEAAEQQFNEAATAPELDLQQRSFYNLGNTLYRKGEKAPDPKEKEKAWEQSAQNYDNALKLNAKDPSAQFNAEFVKKRLEELKKQQEQQKQQSDQNQQDKDKQDKQDEQKDPKDSRSQPKPDQSNDQPASSQQDQKQGQPKQNSQDQKSEEKERQKPADKGSQTQTNSPADAKAPKPGEEKKDGQTKTNAAAAQAPDGRMTRQQAQQLLDAQKAEENALLFAPKETNQPRSRIFKDW